MRCIRYTCMVCYPPEMDRRQVIKCVEYEKEQLKKKIEKSKQKPKLDLFGFPKE
jgi:hypothetical protein